MRICIDARTIKETVNGIGRYSLNLLRPLAVLDRENEYVVLRLPSSSGSLVGNHNFKEVLVPYEISSARNVLAGRAVVNPIRADVYHSLNHFLPMGVRAARVVVTLHDLIWVNEPAIAYDNRWRRWAVHRLASPFIRRALESADHVIAVSESTRQTALLRYGLPAEKVTVVHHGVDPVFSASGRAASPSDCCRGRRFIFSLGSSKPFKNVERLIQAFAAVAPHQPGLFLLIAGRGDGYPRLRRLASELRLAHRVIFTPQLTNEEVRACFERALFFAFPSLTEGFGLPVIEAMASGCPVLASEIPSLVEISGDAALRVDPRSVESIALGMLRLAEDASLRRELARKGRERAASFTWEACAEKTLALYRNLMRTTGVFI